MARLEDMGYITRQHPSAGSVPSDRGYRYYVESLAGIELPLAEQRLIDHLFHQVERELEEWLSLAATIMARLVRNVVVVTLPKLAVCRFKHLELVAVQDSLALVVLVLHGARVKQQLMTFDRVMTQTELAAMANRLNARYGDLARSRILAEGAGLSPLERELTDSLVRMMQAEDEQEYEEPHFDGLHFMLNQPEFAHGHRLLELVELIEQRDLLRIIVPPDLATEGVQVVIGRENRAEVIQECSVLISRYGLPEEAVGTVAVVGPTRMPYARAISTVGHLSSVLSELVAELYGREAPTTLAQPRPLPEE